MAKQNLPRLLPWEISHAHAPLKASPTRYVGAIQSEQYSILHCSITPRVGFEDEDSLSDVAFCARWLAVLSASEVGRTKRLVSGGLCGILTYLFFVFLFAHFAYTSKFRLKQPKRARTFDRKKVV
jgi:hypothetical protein